MKTLDQFREYLLLREKEIRDRETKWENVRNELIEILQAEVYLNNFIKND
jgi:hypothetical protein